MKESFTCICGHTEDHHEFLDNFTGIPEDHEESWCATNLTWDCQCEHYTPDNLSHLERLSADNSSL